MKFNYELIRKNIEVYNEAKLTLPVISEFENGEVNHNTMRTLGLGEFADFYNFKKNLSDRGFKPIMLGCSWRFLKPLLVNNTNNERFKKMMSNRTQNQFKDLFIDGESFDKLINGRWVSKPTLNRRGRMTYGRRSGENMEGLSFCIVPIINYIIQNDIDAFELSKNHYKSFVEQDKVYSSIKWYTNVELKLDKVPKREIDVTRKLISNFLQIMEETNVDFRKLNSDYIISTISDKIRKSMVVTTGTMLKCIKDVERSWGGTKSALVKDNSYEVRNSTTSNGFVKVLVLNEYNQTDWYEYSNFEDMAFHRDDLLNSLFGS